MNDVVMRTMEYVSEEGAGVEKEVQVVVIYDD